MENTMKEKMNLVFVSSKEYAQYLTVLLESIKRNNEDVYLNCYLLHKNIRKEEKEFLDRVFPDSEIGKINYIFIDEEQVRWIFGNKFEKYPIEACAKLFISWLVPEELERVLYLDIDMIVNGSLSELYHTPFEEKLMVACEAMCRTLDWEPYINKKDREHYRKKFPYGTYINSGMMLLAVQKIRKSISIEQFKEAITALDYYVPFVEQDVHSYVYCGKIKYVDYRYNFCLYPGLFELSREKGGERIQRRI